MHLYLHIPFCHRICPYCSFYKHTPGNTNLSVFVDALIHEAQYQQRKNSLPPLTTIYLGGGTPSMLSPTHLTKLIHGLKNTFNTQTLEEFTLEANPATFTQKTADLYHQLGVTRVSLGVQSFLPSQLKTLGREHTPEQAIQSVQLLKTIPSLEVNLDLIFSVPGQSLADWQNSLQQAIALHPHHISAYNLTYEEDTPFFQKFAAGQYHDDSDLNARMFLLAESSLTAAGYEHYETSNYALPGRRSRHNQGYWLGNDYLGLGPSAVSTINRHRWQNVPDTQAYLQRVQAIGHAQDSHEILDDEAWRLERIALQLRTAEGLPLEYLSPQADLTPLTAFLQKTKTHLRLIGDGPLLVDSIAVEL